MPNRADPDQLASSSTLFAKAEYTLVQQDKKVFVLMLFLFLHEKL